MRATRHGSRRGWWAALAVLLSLRALAAAAPAERAGEGLKVELDRTRIHAGESVVLTIRVPASVSEERPDLAPLARDFRVLDTRRSTQVRVAGGERTAVTRWQLQLEPRHRGDLRIPALSVGDRRTRALALQVEAAARAERDATRDFFVEAEVVPERPYVQQQLRFTLRVFHAVPLVEGRLQPPQAPDLAVERMGADRRYETTVAGRGYSVIERRFALYPERSGSLRIPALRFDARLGQRRTAGDIGGFLNQGVPRSAKTRPLELRVRRQPPGYGGAEWLPARGLSLRGSLEDDGEWRVGRPVSRVIEIRGRGLRSSQLPELRHPEIDGARVYPDKPQAGDSYERDWAVGHRRRRFAIVPQRAGELRLPALSVTWWDVTAGRERVAELPGRSVQVAAATPVGDSGARVSEAPVDMVGPAARTVWPWLAAAALALWLGTGAAWWWRERRRRHTARSRQRPVGDDYRRAARALRAACRRGDAPAAKEAALAWGRARWPGDPPISLPAIARRLGPGAAADALRELDRCLYAQGTAEDGAMDGAKDGAKDWDGLALWRALSRSEALERGRRRARVDDETELPPLYPRGDRAA